MFVFGKNPVLSAAEIISYMRYRNHAVTYKFLKNAALVSSKERLDAKKIIEDLGGTLKVCELVYSGKPEGVEFEKLLEPNSDKIRFGVSAYSDIRPPKLLWDDFTNRLKKYIKNNSLKFINVPAKNCYGGYCVQYTDYLNKIEKRGGTEIIVYETSDILYAARPLSTHDPFEFRKRDVGRPAQRTIYSIPPRLAKTLVNLSGAKPGDTVLDPFCGIGTIIQESFLMGINSVGVDSDESCIKAADKNMAWIRKRNKSSAKVSLKIGNARKMSSMMPNGSIDAIATEPFLGPPLKKKPSRRHAESILSSVRYIYMDFLKEAHKLLRDGKLVSVVSPNFAIPNGNKIRLDVWRIADSCGFEILKPLRGSGVKEWEGLISVIDAEERHKTRREIFVLRKV